VSRALKVIGLLLAALLAAASAQAQSPGSTIAGPFTVTLPSTQLFSFSQNFNAPVPVQGSYLLRMQISPANSLTALSVSLNGSQIFSLADFSGGKTSVDKAVTLGASNSLSAQIRGAKSTRITLTVFSLLLPKPTTVSPNPLAVNAGLGGTLTATLSPTPTAPGMLSVSSSAAEVASVPSSIAFGAGQASVAIPVTAASSGSATITASANGGQASAVVNVNALPTVSITSPGNGALFNAPATIAVGANATDADGTVTKVEFFDGGTLIGTATSAPYTATLSNVAAGTHALSAKATDNLGATTTSSTVSVTVDAPPVVSLTAPAGGTVYAAPATVALSANATIQVGTVARVDFYQGTTLIGTATSAPYNLSWTNVAAGNYSLTAIATNDAGGTTTSAPVAITVDAPPTISLDSPAGGAVYASGSTILLSATAADTVGTVTKVDFYQGSTFIGTATSAPYTFSWASVVAGAYSLTAVATNDVGQTGTSAAVSIVVATPPTIALTSPSGGATFHAPATISLAADASDAFGNVTKVDFYQGSSLIGTATSAPFAFSWTNVAAGSYSLTAVATNDAGQTSTSAAVAITVNPATLTLYFIDVDHLNTPRAIENAQQQVVWKWDQTEPFGDNLPDENPAGLGVLDFALRFPGQYSDKETRLAYNVFRDYDVAAGRYMQSDPIGLTSGTNTYAYVDNNPLVEADFFGLWAYGHHVHMTQNAARQSCPKLMPGLPIRVGLVDWQPGSQSPQASYRHGMRNGLSGETPQQAAKATTAFIQSELQKCTPDGLANALHAEQDKFSPSHAGSQPWYGGTPSLGHIIGDTVGGGGAFGRAEAASVVLIQRFKAMCPCVCE
jgi:RHS repeat-associated protein